MKLRRVLLCAFAALSLSASLHAASGRIVKTLPHFLDLQGRHTLYPSLFERDGYQAKLKLHPDLCSGMRFDVQWKAHGLQHGRLKLEVRGASTPPRKSETFEVTLPSGGRFSRWTGVQIAGSDYKKLGQILAWRLTLWDGDEQLAEQKSFLW